MLHKLSMLASDSFLFLILCFAPVAAKRKDAQIKRVQRESWDFAVAR